MAQTAKRQRTYDQSFIQYGFTIVMEGNEEKPKCLLCRKVLSAESMKPNKPKTFETTNNEHVGKPRAFFENKIAEPNKQRVYFKKAMTASEQALKASLKVSYLIAYMKPHSIAETLILPAAIELGKTICGEEEVKKNKTKMRPSQTYCNRS